MNSSHAYIHGSIYKEQRPSALTFLFKRILHWIESQQVCLVWAQFRENSVMGRDCRLGPNASCVNFGEPGDIIIGDEVFCRGSLRRGLRGNGKIIIGNEVYIGDDTIINAECRIEIGPLTMIAHSVQLCDSTGHPVDPAQRETDWRISMGKIKQERPPVPSAPITIGSRVWIGLHSIIMKGVVIGDNSIVAAGSVVMNNVPPDTIVGGNPAQILRTVASVKEDK